jgi:hypothetical protein
MYVFAFRNITPLNSIYFVLSLFLGIFETIFMKILSNMRIVIIALSLVLTGIRGEVFQAVLGDWSQDPDRKYGIPYLMVCVWGGGRKKPITKCLFMLFNICKTIWYNKRNQIRRCDVE